MLQSSIVKKILLWFVINTSLAVVIFSFLSINSTIQLHKFFLSILIITYMISSLSNFTGYFLGRYIKKKPLIIGIPFLLSGTFCAAIVGIFISHNIIQLLFNQSVFHYKSTYLIPSLLITAAVTIITVIIERLKESKDNLQKNLDDIKENIDKKNPTKNSLSVKEDEIYHIIEHSDLIYLSSHGKKTTLHTIEKDYVTNQLLKDIDDKLPENFIRIHKQFIVNTKYLSKIKYYEGGRYLAYLKDDDESTLPVSKKIVPLLKEKLGI